MASVKTKASSVRMNEDDFYLMGGTDENGVYTAAIHKFNGLAWEQQGFNLEESGSFIGVAQNVQDDNIYLIGGMSAADKMSKWNRVSQIMEYVYI